MPSLFLTAEPAELFIAETVLMMQFLPVLYAEFLLGPFVNSPRFSLLFMKWSKSSYRRLFPKWKSSVFVTM